MAMTATIACNPTSAVTEQPVTAVVTVSNSAAYIVNMTNVVVYAFPTGGVNPTMGTGISIGQPNFGPNANVAVPASGSLVITVPVTFHAPASGVLSTGTLTYSVGATCYSNDGSVFVPTETTIDVDYAVTYPASQQ